MFDISFSELLMVLIVGFLALKPKDFIDMIHKIKVFFQDLKDNKNYKFLLEEDFDYWNEDSKEKNFNDKEKK